VALWDKLPPRGQIAIFDRSWYGRVLVERVEDFATEKEWKRAYQEINDFERLLIDDGAIIVKIYLHISKDEQLFRFKRRESDPLSIGKSVMKTGAIAKSGMSTIRPPRICSIKPPSISRRGM